MMNRKLELQRRSIPSIQKPLVESYGQESVVPVVSAEPAEAGRLRSAGASILPESFRDFRGHPHSSKSKGCGFWRRRVKSRESNALFSLGAFVRELMMNPRAVGAAFPSSRTLARAMARCVPNCMDGIVVELGAGTGAITAALLERRIPLNRVVVIERSSKLVRLLKKRFPDLCIINGDAQFLDQLLDQHFGKATHPVDVLVSSLPLRSLPKSVVQAIEVQLEQVLSKNGRFIQFTYDLRSDHSGPFRSFTKCGSKIVWRNFPPARVDVFQRVP